MTMRLFFRGGLCMEKILWVRSYEKSIGVRENDGLELVNTYLEEGWKVKHISACTMVDSRVAGQAYIVIEKN